MSMQLSARVSTLEAEVKRLNAVLNELLDMMTEQATPKPNGNGPRQMCPKCGEKPNYYLHVKSCKGKQTGAAL